MQNLQKFKEEIIVKTNQEPLHTQSKNQTDESFSANDYQKHERLSVQCDQCSKEYTDVSPQRQKFPKLQKVISDVLTLLDFVQAEQQKTSSLSPNKSYKLRQQFSELNRMYDTFAYYSQNWCKHCVFYHLKDDLKKLEKIKYEQSSARKSKIRSPNSQQIKSQNLSSQRNYLKDTINDRASPSSVEQVSIKKQKNPMNEQVYETFLQQIHSRLSQITNNQKEQKENTLEVSIKNMIELLIQENQNVKDENTKLKQLYQKFNKKDDVKQVQLLKEENLFLKQIIQKSTQKNNDDHNEKLKEENYKLREMLKLSAKKRENQIIEQLRLENQALQDKLLNQQQQIDEQNTFSQNIHRSPHKHKEQVNNHINSLTFQSFGEQGFQNSVYHEIIDTNETAEIERDKIKNLLKEKKKIMQDLMNTIYQ